MPHRIIYPIQPFFAIQSSRYLKKLSDHPAIAHFYKFKGNYDGHAGRVVPDGTVDIIFQCSREHPRAWVCGTVEKGEESWFEQDATYFGARLMPGFLDHIGDAHVHELVDQAYDMEDLLQGKHIPEQLAEATDFEDQVRLFEKLFLPEIHLQDSTPHTISAEIIQRIYDSKGTIKVNELAEQMHYSRRHLSRCFEQTTGLDIKTFAGFIRFQSVLKGINSGKYENLADAAAEASYYDQAHFQKSFKRFSSMTPRNYEKLIRQSDYQKKLTVC